MTYADPRRCPDCRADLPESARACPHCGIPLDGPTAMQLFQVLTTADGLVGELRRQRDLQSAPTAPAVTAPTYPEAVPPAAAHPGAVAPAPAPRTGVRRATVPQILLGLGAVLLLVAALTFLAVAWSWLGVGGRTVVLVAFTATAAGLAWWWGGRGLRAAGESLSAVAFGLLALDVSGAADAGWTGDLRTATLIGAALVVASVATLAVRRPQLTAGRRSGWLAPVILPQTVAAVGLLVLWVDQADSGWLDDRFAVVATAAALSFLGLALLGRGWQLRTLVGLGLTGLGLWTLALLADALGNVLDDPSLRGLWLGGSGWALLAAAALAVGPALVVRHPAMRVTSALVASAIVAAAIWLPVADEGGTPVALASAGLVAAGSAALVAAPRWAWPVLVPQVAVPLLPATFIGLLQTVASLDRVLLGDVFERPAGTRLGAMADGPGAAWTYPVVTAAFVVGVAALVRTARPGLGARTLLVAAGPTALGVWLTSGALAVGWYDVPLVTVVGALLVAAAATAGLAWRVREPAGRDAAAMLPWVVTGALALGAVVVALPSDVLTALALAPVLLASGALVLVGRSTAADVGHLALPASAGALAVSVASAGGLGPHWWAVPAILVVGLLAVARPRPELEVSAAVTAGLAGVGSALAPEATLSTVAVLLTLAGSLVSASALVHPSRRALGWPGGLLLAAATWARLADLRVEEPEAYTLPSALALVAVGLWRLWRDPATSTAFTLLPGLTLATVPSLLWALVDPFGWRGLLLGLGCLALVVGGTLLRWSAPLLVGAGVGLVLALRLSEPLVAAIPPWVLIGVAGTLLTVIGVTWESRMRDVRTAAAYLSRLR